MGSPQASVVGPVPLQKRVSIRPASRLTPGVRAKCVAGEVDLLGAPLHYKSWVPTSADHLSTMRLAIDSTASGATLGSPLPTVRLRCAQMVSVIESHLRIPGRNIIGDEETGVDETGATAVEIVILSLRG